MFDFTVTDWQAKHKQEHRDLDKKQQTETQQEPGGDEEIDEAALTQLVDHIKLQQRMMNSKS